MKSIVLAVVSVCAVAANAADVGRVIVRQQWPWATTINVDFELSGVSPSAPADISLRCFNGASEIPAATVEKSLSGARYALTEGGTYTLTLDPAVLFPSGTKTVPDFRVTVAASGASEKSLEVLYKIVNLQSPYDVQDVTRAQLLNGEMGAVETDYSRLGAGFSTPLSDVVIWTGVTNNIAYKTTHMVLRKIPAKGQHFQFLKGATITKEDDTTTTAGIDVSFTNDFYIGVFEVTQSQYAKISTHPEGSSYETNALYSATRPVDRMYFTAGMRGSTLGVKWPSGDHTDVDAGRFIKIIQTRTGLVLDLPTEAMWEYACKAKCTAELYNGLSYSQVNLTPIARLRGVNRPNTQSSPDRNCDLSDGPTEVGSYMPNAWGLYDMVGNVRERVLDRVNTTYKYPNSLTLVDPRGPETFYYDGNTTVDRRMLKGGSYITAPLSMKWLYRREYDARAGDADKYTGFRVCLYPDFSL